MAKITFADKVSTIISSLPIINRIRAEDINEIKSVVNTNADSMQEKLINEDLTSQVIVNSSASATEWLKLYKYGNIVHFSFQISHSGNWDNNSVLFTFPSSVFPSTQLYLIVVGAGSNIKYLQLNTEGEIIIENGSNSNWLSGNITYTI